MKCRGGKYKASNFQPNNRSDTEITIKRKYDRSKNIQKCIKTYECSICFVQKPIHDIAFIDCVKKGIYTSNVGRRTTLRHPICNDCEEKCNNLCPFCRSHGFIDRLKYPDKKRFRKKKLPWHIRKIQISIRKKKKELKRLKEELNNSNVSKKSQYYRYIKREYKSLSYSIIYIIREINDFD
tara:strand:+ start:456 stop:998 length:543 start_codon:yes stop_codon:yes gene_type:complete